MLTATPVRMGTPAYMAPETILGSEVDRRVDVYALGCVAYYLLTGERVFDAQTQMKLLMQHLNDEPIPPSQRTEQFVPREVDEIVLSCLHKDPGQRPGDANELFRMLSRSQDLGRGITSAARKWWEAHLPEMTKPLSDEHRGMGYRESIACRSSSRLIRATDWRKS